MKALLLLGLLAVASAAVTPAADPGTPGTDALNPTSPNTQWNYQSSGTNWNLGWCRVGKAQSPINIEKESTHCVRKGEIHSLPYRIDFHYFPRNNLSMVNTGHGLQVNTDLGFVTLGGCNPCNGHQYNLKQFNFHTPAEHTIDARPGKTGYALELQLIHQKVGATGLNDLVGVSILFYQQHEGGFPNSFLNLVDVMHAPATLNAVNPIQGIVDMHTLKESLHGEYYTYKGSLTAPTCDETVTWFVMKNPLGVSKHQLAKIQSLFQGNKEFAMGNGNARATQALNGRPVIWYRKPW